jgi:hypothetical protein
MIGTVLRIARLKKLVSVTFLLIDDDVTCFTFSIPFGYLQNYVVAFVLIFCFAGSHFYCAVILLQSSTF